MQQALTRFGQFEIKTLSDLYPDHGSAVPDTEWIRDAAARGWIVFTQDEALRKHAEERAAIQAHGVKVFALSSQSIPVPSKTLWYGRHLLAILRRGNKPGGCLWRIYPTHTKKDIA